MAVLDDLPLTLPPEMEARYRGAWPSDDLLAEAVAPANESHVLLLGCAADPLCLVVARRVDAGSCVVVDDDAAAGARLAEVAAAAGLTNLRVLDPAALDPARLDARSLDPAARDAGPWSGTDLAAAPASLDLAITNTLYHPSKAVTRELLALAHRLLPSGARVYAAGATDRGIRSIAAEMAALFGHAETLALRKGHRVVVAERGSGPPAATRSAEPALTEAVVCGEPMLLEAAPGVFAGGMLDPAAALLAGAIAIRPGEVTVDLGCGSGVIGLAVARRDPTGHVYLLDSSHAAARLAAANARRNGIANVTVLAGDAIALLRARAVRPDLVVTNPPFHTGQMETRLTARGLIAGAAERLAPGGRLYLVANRFLPYEADLRAHFAAVGEVAADARYKVLLAERPNATE